MTSRGPSVLESRDTDTVQWKSESVTNQWIHGLGARDAICILNASDWSFVQVYQRVPVLGAFFHPLIEGTSASPEQIFG